MPLLDVAFLLVLGLAVAATAQITGVLLVFALLVASAAAAQQLTSRIGVGLSHERGGLAGAPARLHGVPEGAMTVPRS